jgi:RNA-directed DNA polymerase
MAPAKKQEQKQGDTPRRLLNIRTLRHLSLRLDLPLQLLEDLALDTASRYKPPRPQSKKGGGTRTIEPPPLALKQVQRQILAKLLARLWLPDVIHAYRPGRSVQTAIEPHRRKPFLWVADVKHFYPSISDVRVYRMFLQLGCTPEISKLLTRLTTHRHRLPQGAPTRPALANLYLRLSGLVSRLAGLARKHGLCVTYFGDDILVSGENSFMGLAGHLEKIFRAAGLRLHPTKTRPVAGPAESHAALGVVMDPESGEIDVPKSYRRRLKALILMCVRFGPGVLAAKGITHKNPKAYLAGKIAYAARINAQNSALLKCLDEIDWGESWKRTKRKERPPKPLSRSRPSSVEKKEPHLRSQRAG